MDSKIIIQNLQKDLMNRDSSVVENAIFLNKLGVLGDYNEFDGWLQTLISTGEVDCVEERIDQAISFLNVDMIDWSTQT
jgi:hypothetical protein